MNVIQELFPGRIQKKLVCLEQHINNIQEIRVRVNTPIIIWMNGKEYTVLSSGQFSRQILEGMIMNAKDLEECVMHICHSSLYAYEEETRRGYISMEGGHRIGITGQVVLDESNKIRTIKNISFLNIRLAHEIIDAADKVLMHLYERKQLQNTLIISPPGFGKTTLLRDLIRQVSNGNMYGGGKNCSVIDERSELAGSFRGVPQLNVGIRTDVLDGCPKSIGMMMVIRAMGPQVIAVDELGNLEDIRALFAVIRSGCNVLATIHGDNIESLREKSYLKQVMEEKVFQRYVVIRNSRHEIDVFDGELQRC